MSEKIIGRQHRIHLVKNGKPLCGQKGWAAQDTNLENVECKRCLKIAETTGGKDGR